MAANCPTLGVLLHAALTLAVGVLVGLVVYGMGWNRGYVAGKEDSRRPPSGADDAND